MAQIVHFLARSCLLEKDRQRKATSFLATRAWPNAAKIRNSLYITVSISASPCLDSASRYLSCIPAIAAHASGRRRKC